MWSNKDFGHDIIRIDDDGLHYEFLAVNRLKLSA